MDIQITKQDNTHEVVTGVTRLEIADTDSAAPLREKLAMLQAQAAGLAANVAALAQALADAAGS